MNRPNILLLLPDQHRPDWTGAHSSLPVRTPHLDRLGERGVRFTRAYCPSPLCAPSRACLASGRNYVSCSVPDNNSDYPLDQRTYYTALRDAGYETCGVGKFDLHKDVSDKANMDWFLDGSRLLSEWGFTSGIDNEGKIDGSTSYAAAGMPKGPYMKLLHDLGVADRYVQEHAAMKENRGAYLTSVPDDAYCDNWIAENGLAFLKGFDKERPWHLVVNFTGPHNPMDVTPSMASAWENVSFPPPHDCRDSRYSDADHQRNRRYYAAMIENIDRHVGRFIDVVAERGETDNTIVVYSSDHGEMLGDHGRWGKNVHYEPSVGVPMTITGPGYQQDRTSDALVQLQDLTATFLDAAGVDPLPEMEGRSLRELLTGGTDTHRRYAVSALDPWRAVIGDQYKLVSGVDGGPMLYDLSADPYEDHNIAEDHPEIVNQMSEDGFPFN